MKTRNPLISNLVGTVVLCWWQKTLTKIEKVEDNIDDRQQFCYVPIFSGDKYITGDFKTFEVVIHLFKLKVTNIVIIKF